MYEFHITGTSSGANGKVHPFERRVVIPRKTTPTERGDVLVLGKFRGNTSSANVANQVYDNLTACGCAVHRHDGTDLHLASASSGLTQDICGLTQDILARIGYIVIARSPQTGITSLDDFHKTSPCHAAAVARSHRIMYVAWETPELPPDWVPLMGACHEIWAPSTFVGDAVLKSFPPGCGTAVNVVPHTVPDLDHIEGDRAKFCLPEDKLIVMTNFSFRSGMRRKNPLATVEAFQKAMKIRGNPDDAVLVIKTSLSNLAPKGFALLKKRVNDDPRIMLIDGLFPSFRDVYELTKCADVFMSLSGAEGFGLSPAEAMRLGLPVIATDYAGHRDFIPGEFAVPIKGVTKVTHECDPDGHWLDCVLAQPDTDVAAMYLAALLDSPSTRQMAGHRARELAKQKFGVENFVRRIPHVIQGAGGTMPEREIKADFAPAATGAVHSQDYRKPHTMRHHGPRAPFNRKSVTAVTVVAFNEEGKVLVVWEDGKSPSLPGGHVEPLDRTFEETARRELWEEARVEVAGSLPVADVVSSTWCKPPLQHGRGTYLLLMAGKVTAVHPFRPNEETLSRAFVSVSEFVENLYTGGNKEEMRKSLLLARAALNLRRKPGAPEGPT
jgi:glycosyltransferase involved in cell wall biosynthesis/8-oxo-dGTP pyrophosphatase MutT (NUDIX family)